MDAGSWLVLASRLISGAERTRAESLSARTAELNDVNQLCQLSMLSVATRGGSLLGSDGIGRNAASRDTALERHVTACDMRHASPQPKTAKQ